MNTKTRQPTSALEKILQSPSDVPPPKYCTVDYWIALTSMGRRSVYDRLGTGELTGIKVGGRTLIDVEAGLAWLRSCPPAVIRAPRPRQAA